MIKLKVDVILVGRIDAGNKPPSGAIKPWEVGSKFTPTPMPSSRKKSPKLQFYFHQLWENATKFKRLLDIQYCCNQFQTHLSRETHPRVGLLRAVQKWRPILLQQYLPDPSVELLPGSSLCWCCRSFGHLLVPHTQWTNPNGAGHKRAIVVEENTSCLSGFEVKRLGRSLRKSAVTTCMYDPVCIYNI